MDRIRGAHKQLRKWTRYTVLGVLLVWVLALGGVHPAVNLVLGMCIITAAGIGWSVGKPLGSREMLRNPMVALLSLMALATAIQLIPVPAALFALGDNDIKMGIVAASGREWVTASLDPIATAHELLKTLTYLASAILAITLFASPPKRRLILRAVAISGTATLCIAALHALLDWNTTYNQFGPSRSVLVGSLVNSNHLGTLLGSASLASAAHARLQQSYRWLFVLNAVGCGMGLFFTLSRGAIVVFVVIVLLVGIALSVRGSKQNSRQMREIWPVVAVLCAALGAVALLYRRLVYEYLPPSVGQTTHPKIELWKSASEIALDFPIVGVGRGALASISHHYHDWASEVTVTHLESEWLQALVDWGLLFGIPIIVLAAYAGIRAARIVQPRYYLELSTVGMVALHNAFEFSVFLPAIAIPTVMLLTAMLHQGRNSAETHRNVESRPRSSTYAILTTCGSIAGMGLFCGILAIAFDVQRDTQRVKKSVDSCSPQWIDLLQSAVTRHPADYFLPLYGARGALCNGNARNALHWANRSLRLRKNFYATHQIIAHALWRMGAQSQAVMEIRLACEASPNRCPSLLADFQILKPTEDLVAKIADSDDLEVRAAVVSHLLRENKRRAALKALGDGNDGHPGLLALRFRAQQELKLFHDAMETAQKHVALLPKDGHMYRQWAELHIAMGQPAQALEIMQLGLKHVPHNEELLHTRARLLVNNGELEEALVAAEAMLRNSLNPGPRSAAYALIGEIQERQGSYARALWAYRKARDLHPHIESYRLSLASLQRHMGDHVGARREIEKAIEELGTSPALSDALHRNAALEGPAD